MTQSQHDWHWLDAGEAIAITELSVACGVTIDELQELVEYGALRPVATQHEQRLFTADWVMPLRAASRMRRDYDLDLFTVALLLEQLQRIEQLEQALRSARAQLPIHASEGAVRDAPGAWREPHGRDRD